MRRLLVPLVLVLSVGGSLGGCGWAGRHAETSKPDVFQLQGYVSVGGAASGVPGTPCLAPTSVPDVVAGATVRAADADGKVIAVSSLDSGVLAQASDGFRCNFAFRMKNLSGSRPSYQILVGDRPAQTFQTRELTEGKPAVVTVTASS
ncbi:hypothetical protein ACFFX1_53145 [Dactylosporangium sucinum]|uniref:Lipoprotein n=1 Tax=Dactylosporangium sucinum TaxID=1424081 RepID=A0A917UF73_9ACTN|nr:hypothetical protein [Dactylosporangium sucinum]GGM81774.1 hypothetical protein GCM10007977_099010 [Dactylosporangium sucinum]